MQTEISRIISEATRRGFTFTSVAGFLDVINDLGLELRFKAKDALAPATVPIPESSNGRGSGRRGYRALVIKAIHEGARFANEIIEKIPIGTHCGELAGALSSLRSVGYITQNTATGEIHFTTQGNKVAEYLVANPHLKILPPNWRA